MITLKELYDLSYTETDERDWSRYKAILLDTMIEFLREKWVLDENIVQSNE